MTDYHSPRYCIAGCTAHALNDLNSSPTST
jgi:hypothetical protein